MTTITAINQISYSERDIGKMNPESKREVGMHFSVNGREYDILLVWSFASGKQSIFVNGIEEVFTKNSGASIIDVKFQFEGLNFQLIGTRTRPKGSSYDYKCFELLIDGILLSDCPREGSTELSPSTKDNSIIDLLYPDHPCRKNRGVPALSAPKGHMYASVEDSKPSKHLNALSSPAQTPVTNAAPDLLLDFNPMGSDTRNDRSVISPDFLVPTDQTPAYSNYNMFNQPQVDPSQSMGGQMVVPPFYSSSAPTSCTLEMPLGSHVTGVSNFGSTHVNPNDASTIYGGSPSIHPVSNHFSYNTASPPPPMESIHPSHLVPTNDHSTYTNYSYFDTPTSPTTEASNQFSVTAHPPGSPVQGSGFQSINPFESNFNYTNHAMAADPYSQANTPPITFNAMQTADTNPFGGF